MPARPRLAVAAWVLAGLAGLAALAVFRAWMPSGATTCVMLTLTGVPCPGCGMTRASAFLARGDLAGSFRMHPLAVVFAAQAAVAWTWWGLVLARRVRVPSPWWGIVPLAFDCVALPAVWLVRWALDALPR